MSPKRTHSATHADEEQPHKRAKTTIDTLLDEIVTLSKQWNTPRATVNEPPSTTNLVSSTLHYYRGIQEKLSKTSLKCESAFRWQDVGFRIYTFGICLSEFADFSNHPDYNMFYYSIIYQTNKQHARLLKYKQSYKCAEDLDEEERNGYLLDDLHYIHENVIQEIYKELYASLTLCIE